MKKLFFTMLAVAILPCIGWGDFPGDTDDLDMPVYYYTGNDTAAELPRTGGLGVSWGHAERSAYDLEQRWDYDPINMEFINRMNLYSDDYLLRVELSDHLLEWYIWVNSDWQNFGDSRRVLAGGRTDNSTGITLAVYTLNSNGARVTFSGAEDLRGVANPDVTLPTYYCFGTTSTIPAQDQLIRAENINTGVSGYNLFVPYNKETTWCIWSAVDVDYTTPRPDQYKDPENFFITVQNIP